MRGADEWIEDITMSNEGRLVIKWGGGRRVEVWTVGPKCVHSG